MMIILYFYGIEAFLYFVLSYLEDRMIEIKGIDFIPILGSCLFLMDYLEGNR